MILLYTKSMFHRSLERHCNYINAKTFNVLYFIPAHLHVNGKKVVTSHIFGRRHLIALQHLK